MTHSKLIALFIVMLVSSVAPRASCADEPEASWSETPLTARDREHWSFRPLARPAVPQVVSRDWPRTSIDRFILHALEERSLAPRVEAERATLVRRVTLDLTGLPPTPEELDAALADARPDWYEQLVDRLLTSPRFGPRWAQFWLDLARFAETDGYEFDLRRPDAWRYRDWTVAAADADLPYDEFLLHQLAADQQFGDESPAAVATGFCLAGPDMPDINSQVERKDALLNELTGAVGSVFLGLQIGCARCHEHKFDPVTQGDFFRLRAFFEPAVRLERNKSVRYLESKADADAVTHILVRGDWRQPGPPVAPDYPRIANLAAVPAPDPAAPEAARIALARWMTQGDHPLTSRVIANRVWQFHFGRGLSDTPSDFGLAGDSPSHPALLDWLATELIRKEWSLKALHRHIVLSATYRQAGYSAPQASGTQSDADSKLSDDRARHERWYACFPRRRLEAEAVRDALLSVAGELNEQRGGPGVRPPLPEELRLTLLKDQWEPTPDRAQHRRRSVYLFARRNLRFPLLEAFDRPDANQSCARRHTSTTATQSLMLLNSPFTLEMAQCLAGSVCQGVQGEDDRQKAVIASAFRRAWGRLPDESEQQFARTFLEQQTRLLEQEQRTPETLALPIPAPPDLNPCTAAALTDLCLTLLGANEFLYVD